MKRPDKLTWLEPMAKRLPEIKRELAEIYSPWAIVRIAALVAAITAIGAVVLHRQMPELEIDWGR